MKNFTNGLRSKVKDMKDFETIKIDDKYIISFHIFKEEIALKDSIKEIDKNFNYFIIEIYEIKEKNEFDDCEINFKIMFNKKKKIVLNKIKENIFDSEESDSISDSLNDSFSK